MKINENVFPPLYFSAVVAFRLKTPQESPLAAVHKRKSRKQNLDVHV